MDAAAASFGNLMLLVAALGTAWAWLTQRRRAFVWSLVLWLPVPFYTWSVAYGSAPIFLPAWWPHSWYNTRYGIELLPALALGLGFAASFALAAVREFKAGWTQIAAFAILVLLAANAAIMARERPLVYVEGTGNAEARRPYEAILSAALRTQLARHPGGIVLMDTSVYPQVVALSGIALRQTINESDKEYYQAALASPAERAALVLAFDGDEIDQAVHAHPAALTAVAHLAWPGQTASTLYVSDTSPAGEAIAAGTR
jgi:hypothetical protein